MWVHWPWLFVPNWVFFFCCGPFCKHRTTYLRPLPPALLCVAFKPLVNACASVVVSISVSRYAVNPSAIDNIAFRLLSICTLYISRSCRSDILASLIHYQTNQSLHTDPNCSITHLLRAQTLPGGGGRAAHPRSCKPDLSCGWVSCLGTGLAGMYLLITGIYSVAFDRMG